LAAGLITLQSKKVYDEVSQNTSGFGGKNNIKTDLKEIRYEDTDWIQLAQYSVMADSCEHGNEISGSIKSGEFLDRLSNHLLLNKDPAPWS
jgi:hypothetical protein